MSTVLAVSPHLDDVAFSCGGVLATLSRAGWRVRVVTVFTATVTPLSPFALACQLDKGLSADVDYMALRRDEDAVAMHCLGVDEWEHLDLPEAPHRGYVSAADLFAGRHADDDVCQAVTSALALRVARADLVLGPLGLGHHVDHGVVVDALDDLERAGMDVPRLRYRDTPYAVRLCSSTRADDEVPVEVGTAMDDKIAACAAYVSQLGFQFGGPGGMSRALREFAATEARRCGGTGSAEVLVGPAASRERLATLSPLMSGGSDRG
jgi:LmbE family N-acetylglucosaminyl deacetylase